MINKTTKFLYTQKRAHGKLELKKHLKKGVFIQDLKTNAIFVAAEMFCPLKLSDVPHFTDAGGHVSPKKKSRGKTLMSNVGFELVNLLF